MATTSSDVQTLPKVDPSANRYPYCVVWSPLPVITWLFPFIGHLGICDSNGVIWDFAGPYTIGCEHMAFGAPTRYMQLSPERATKTSWNQVRLFLSTIDLPGNMRSQTTNTRCCVSVCLSVCLSLCTCVSFRVCRKATKYTQTECIFYVGITAITTWLSV